MEIKPNRLPMSKNLIRKALIDLLLTYPMNKINVTMICNQAGVSRGTFYAYFSDVYDVYAHIEENTYDLLSFYLNPEHTLSEVLNDVFEFMYDYKHLFQMYTNDNNLKQFTTLLFKLKTEQLKSAKLTELSNNLYPKDRLYMEYFLIGGLISIIKKWLSEDMPESPAHMASIVENLLTNKNK